MIEPTESGKERYPFGVPGFYQRVYLCTCSETCAHPCKGACGCAACDEAYEDWLVDFDY